MYNNAKHLNHQNIELFDVSDNILNKIQFQDNFLYKNNNL